MNLAKMILVGGLVAGLVGCGTVRTDAWTGRGVDALDAHPLLRTLPMLRMIDANGLEQRTYQSRANAPQCYAEGGVVPGRLMTAATHGQTLECTSRSSGCDFVFTLREGRVVRQATNGRMLDARECAAALGTPRG